MVKRVFLFLAVNILVMATISIVTNVLGLNRYITEYGINYYALMGFCLAWGMGGAFISLLLSKTIAKWAMGVKIVGQGNYQDLMEMVRRLSQTAQIPMPEVGVYESPELNAFATGASKKNSLIAVSTGLLGRMNRDEVEGVIAHELSHIANGDMVTMTLIAGIVNAFAMFLSRIIGFFVGKMVKEDLEYIVRVIVTIVMDILLTILGSLVVNYFSRLREFKADSGAARLAGRGKMIAALEKLKSEYEFVDHRGASLATMKISGKQGFMALFSTHPSLDKRIEALRKLS